MSKFTSRLKFSSGLMALSCALAVNSHAVQFQAWEGVQGAFDTTLSVGTNIRVEDRAKNLIGRGHKNGGTADSINYDEGDLNWGRGATALAAKATHELSLTGETMGFFGRFNYFYDFVNSDTNKLNKTAKRYVGHNVKLQDLYVYKDFDDLVGRQFRVKAGNQVINWGESTFILGGVNAINPIDVSAFRVPGAEVRDALLPIPAVDLSFAVTDDLSFEGFYQFAFEETKLEARGSYFSTNNFASPGGDTVYLGFGDPQIEANRGGRVTSNPIIVNPDPAYAANVGPLAPFGSWVPRGEDRKASDQGEWGLASRIFSETLYDTEFGFYYTHLHSRVPLISANLATLAQFIGSNSTTYANDSNYFLEYPEHIKTLGASFATDLGATGISLSGEATHKINQPLQIHSVDLLQAALAPAAINGTSALEAVTPALAGRTVELAQTFNTNPIIQDLGGIDTSSRLAAAGDAARFFGTEMSGYKRKHVSQAQVTALKLFGPAIGADQWVAVGELGVVHIHNFPSKSKMRFDGPGLYKSGNANFINIGGMPSAQRLKDFPDATSYGYRLVARFDYLDVWDGVNVFPSFKFSHDFKGTTPNPLGTFVKGRKAAGASISATYLERLSGEIAYNHFFGGGAQNLLRDRDFVSATIKYSF